MKAAQSRIENRLPNRLMFSNSTTPPQSVELLQKRYELLESKIAKELDRARDFNSKGNKQRALVCLRAKATYQKQLEILDGQIARLTEQQLQLEGMSTTATTVAAMQHAARVQKQRMAALKVDKVDDMIEELNESNYKINEINEALAQPIGTGAAVDDDELLEELNELEANELQGELLQPATIPERVETTAEDELPSVPTRPVPAKHARPTTADQELEDLMKEMA